MKNHKMLLERLKLYNVPSELIAEIEAEFEEIKKNSDRYLEQLLDARHQLVKQDAVLENQKTTIEETRRALESLTRQNESMKTLLMEEWR